MVSAAGLTGKTAILTGPTASGKTALAFELIASRPEYGNIEIINADSLLVYRGMDIGTAKPSREERARIRHHLIDIRDPDEPFTAGDFRRAALEALAEIEAGGRRALIVGGTGFYLKALLYGLWDAPKGDPTLRAEFDRRESAELHHELETIDATSAARIGPSDRYRLIRALELVRLSGKTPTELEAEQSRQEPDPRFALWIIDRENPELHARIEERSRAMLREGLVEETSSLLARYPGARPLDSVGYRETVAFLEGLAPEGRPMRPGIDGLADEISLATRQLVKRQRTWFRGQAKSARWFQLDRDREALFQAWSGFYD